MTEEKKEALHHQIKQYRAYSVVIILFSMYVTLDLIEFLKDNYTDMSQPAALAFSSIALATIAIVKYALEALMKRAEKDD